MRTGAIIFSRMQSKRFPGKAMKNILGKPLLERVVERAKKIKLIDHMCIATSNLVQDDIIYDFAVSKGIEVFRGDEDDVARRAFEAGLLFKYDCFVRICGDRPFFDGRIVDEAVMIHKKNKNDLTTNIYPRTIPSGLTVEVINMSALNKVLSSTINKKDREHITRYMYKNPKIFKIENIKALKKIDFDISNLNVTIDTINDIKKAEYIAKELSNKNQYNDFNEVINLLKKYIKNDYTRNT